MDSITYRNRRAVSIENDRIRVIATEEGGHLAEILHKPTNVNPLWTPPWPSIEPSTYNRQQHPDYGFDEEAPLLAGILGHNICLDTFGAPSPEEAAAGMPVHGEAPVAPYQISSADKWIELQATLPKAQLKFKRRISVAPDSIVVRISEELENLSPSDRPIAWTQHVTMGPPFLEPGQTQFALTATQSKVIGSGFNSGKGMQQSGAEFSWPFCPMKDGRISDLRVFTADEVSGGFTAHLMDIAKKQAHFLAWSPVTKVLFGYVWNRADFPWLARWEENHLRTQPPWNGQGLACAMEFGVSPLVESRRQMVDRGSLFGVPGFRWLPARTKAQVNYCAFITTAESMPESVIWDGDSQLNF
ncbi:MAG TPA: hypothetical protein VHZ07_16285 [Bryobacteraceae bacterium]|jgi:hypothetical protein|nr:hypothetical protein [Bryobacteraceae bacterium]